MPAPNTPLEPLVANNVALAVQNPPVEQSVAEHVPMAVIPAPVQSSDTGNVPMTVQKVEDDTSTNYLKRAKLSRVNSDADNCVSGTSAEYSSSIVAKQASPERKNKFIVQEVMNEENEKLAAALALTTAMEESTMTVEVMAMMVEESLSFVSSTPQAQVTEAAEMAALPVIPDALIIEAPPQPVIPATLPSLTNKPSPPAPLVQVLPLPPMITTQVIQAMDKSVMAVSPAAPITAVAPPVFAAEQSVVLPPPTAEVQSEVVNNSDEMDVEAEDGTDVGTEVGEEDEEALLTEIVDDHVLREEQQQQQDEREDEGINQAYGHNNEENEDEAGADQSTAVRSMQFVESMERDDKEETFTILRTAILAYFKTFRWIVEDEYAPAAQKYPFIISPWLQKEFGRHCNGINIDHELYKGVYAKEARAYLQHLRKKSTETHDPCTINNGHDLVANRFRNDLVRFWRKVGLVKPHKAVYSFTPDETDITPMMPLGFLFYRFHPLYLEELAFDAALHCYKKWPTKGVTYTDQEIRSKVQALISTDAENYSATYSVRISTDMQEFDNSLVKNYFLAKNASSSHCATSTAAQASAAVSVQDTASTTEDNADVDDYENVTIGTVLYLLYFTTFVTHFACLFARASTKQCQR